MKWIIKVLYILKHLASAVAVMGIALPKHRITYYTKKYKCFNDLQGVTNFCIHSLSLTTCNMGGIW